MNITNVSIVAALIIVASAMFGYGNGPDGAKVGALIGFGLAIVWALFAVVKVLREKANKRRRIL